ncbi:MAG: hypothetical protein K6F34_06700 [Lachnospiraceae bacterium]|nr:hypothetical protein [Lachnospiraceae bacterium]
MLKKARRFYPYILIALCAAVLLIRCFYSFCWSDETFYFSTCHRFYMGDDIFRDEWFPTQLSSLILLPFYALYMLVMGSNTGVFLYFRILYVILSTVNAVLMFNIIKRRERTFIALSCSLCLMFYTHLNIATLSYYTLSVQMFLMSMLFIYHYGTSREVKHLVYSGALFALSVLCLPTLCVAYFAAVAFLALLSLAVRYVRPLKGLKDTLDGAHLKEIFLYTLSGIMIPFFLFVLYLVFTVPVSDFIKGIPYVLSDEEHATGLVYPAKKFFIGINEVYGRAAYISYFLTAAAFAASFTGLFKKGLARLALFAADFILFIVLAIRSMGHTGYIQTALCLFTLPLFFTGKEKDRRPFFLFIVSGMIFSLVFSYSSNGYLYILSMGHFIASIGCILILGRQTGAKEIKKSGPVITAACTAVICTVIITTAALRLVNIYRDAPLDMLDTKITEGPAAGLYTTKDHRDSYMTVYETIQAACRSGNLKEPSKYPNSMELDSRNVGNIFITKLLPWGYMCTDLRCASPTTWRTSFDSKRLEPYYEMNPGRYPDIILVLDEEYGSYLSCGDVEADPSPNENSVGGYLFDYVTGNDYEKISVPCGFLYVRP